MEDGHGIVWTGCFDFDDRYDNDNVVTFIKGNLVKLLTTDKDDCFDLYVIVKSISHAVERMASSIEMYKNAERCCRNVLEKKHAEIDRLNTEINRLNKLLMEKNSKEGS